jgi:hypothetical protein
MVALNATTHVLLDGEVKVYKRGNSRLWQATCQRQSKSEPKGSAKCCHFGVGIISV